MQVGQLVISSNQNLVYAGLPSLTNKLATPTAIADNPFVYWEMYVNDSAFNNDISESCARRTVHLLMRVQTLLDAIMLERIS